MTDALFQHGLFDAFAYGIDIDSYRGCHAASPHQGEPIADPHGFWRNLTVCEPIGGLIELRGNA